MKTNTGLFANEDDKLTCAAPAYLMLKNVTLLRAHMRRALTGISPLSKRAQLGCTHLELAKQMELTKGSCSNPVRLDWSWYMAGYTAGVDGPARDWGNPMEMAEDDMGRIWLAWWIVPPRDFDLTTPGEWRKCFHKDNLRAVTVDRMSVDPDEQHETQGEVLEVIRPATPATRLIYSQTYSPRPENNSNFLVD